MNIFCKETQAHLQLHPHLKDTAGASVKTTSGASGTPASSVGSTLITPELWMRDCRSESPDSDKSRSPERIPSPIIEITTSNTSKITPSSSPGVEDDLKPTNLVISPKPIVSPAALGQRPSKRDNIHKPRRIVRNKRTQKVVAPIVTPQVEVSTNSSSPRSTNSGSPPRTLPPPLIPQMPPYSLPNSLLPPDHPLHRPPFLNPGFFPPPHILAELAARFPLPPRPQIRKPHPNNNLPPLLPLNQNVRFPPPMGFAAPPPPQPPPPVPQSLLPPPTLMVPYPVLVPIPIPIPIIIPIPPNFKLKEQQKNDENSNTNSLEIPNIKIEAQSPPPPTSPSTNVNLSQPLRKRKRPELTSDDELLHKQKSVPA